MPLFEFTCADCGRVFEELLSLAELEAGAVACPACRSVKVERGLSSFASGGGDRAAGGGGCRGGACGSGGFS
jgi:putative FmdB family regulatory protein